MPCPVCAQRHGDTPNLNNGSNKEKPSDHVLVAGAEFNKMADELCNGPSIAIEVRAENAVQVFAASTSAPRFLLPLAVSWSRLGTRYVDAMSGAVLR